MDGFMIKKFLTVLVILFVFVSYPLMSCAEQLTILHTNDTHSHLYSFGTFNQYGGMARMSYLIKKLKRQNSNVLTVNAGDVFVGTFAFNKYLGYAELKIMEELYDVMCLGNHEFDLGVKTLTGILSGVLSGGAPVGLPILCANVDFKQCHELKNFVKPSMIQQVGPLKIGLVGVVTTDEFNYSQEVNAILTNPYKAAGAEALALREQGCDVVICLSHLGKVPDVEGLSKVPGIDIIIGGHSHDAIFKPIIKNKKIIVQAGEFGKYVGELKVRVKKGKVKVLNYKLHPINRRVRRDWTLIKTLFDLKKGIRQDPRFGPVYTKPIAWARWNLEERWEEGNPHRDTALGNLVADAIRDGVDNSGMVPQDGSPLIALEANGYIAHRIYRGMVVGNDVMRTVPYGYNRESGLGFKIKVVQLAGAHILAGLEYTVSMVELLDDLSLQVSGLKFEYDSSKLPGLRVDPDSVMIYNSVKDQWQPLNSGRLYWVAITEQLLGFLQSLGVKPNKMIGTGLFEYKVVRDYMRKLKILKYKSEGRIIDTALLPGAGK